MNIQSLRLYDFRNISELENRFSPGINILYGENAQGKSNILESIFYLSSLRPTRAVREVELIQHEKPLAFVRGSFDTRRGIVDRQVTLHRNKKKEVKEGETIKTRWSELFHPINAVYFSPEDLSLVKGEPALRRRFLDQIIFQVRPAHYKYLQGYYRVLSQRNALLKEIRKRSQSASSLDPWDEQMADLGSLLILSRLELIEKISAESRDYYKGITRHQNHLELKYKSSIDIEGKGSLREGFLHQLQSHRGVDIMRSYTTLGPHRDDVEFFIDGKEAKIFASQGQQRLLSLCLRFAQRKVLYLENGDEPILLLDDVMSELDLSKRRLILEGQGQQVFITTTDLSYIPEELLKHSQCFLVEDGKMR